VPLTYSQRDVYDSPQHTQTVKQTILWLDIQQKICVCMSHTSNRWGKNRAITLGVLAYAYRTVIFRLCSWYKPNGKHKAIPAASNSMETHTEMKWVKT